MSLLGPIAAGEKVLKSSKGAVATLLRQHYSDALAVEMEGAGFLYAAYACSADAIVVRGISDLLDGKPESDALGSQEIAAAHASAFTFELLARLDRLGTERIIAEARAPIEPAEPGHDIWAALRELASRLYPRGPCEKDVWQNAGGDLSSLVLTEDGRTQWSRALRLIQFGGGGRNITLAILFERMLQDFPSNLELAYLRDRAISLEP